MEERIARLESHIEYLITQVRDLKDELRSLRDRVDVQFDALRGRPTLNSRFATGLLSRLDLGTARNSRQRGRALSARCSSRAARSAAAGLESPL